MSCSAEIKGNAACKTCKLKEIVRQDGWGSDYLEAGRVPENRVVTKPGNAWIGVPRRKVVYCARELGIPVKEMP